MSNFLKIILVIFFALVLAMDDNHDPFANIKKDLGLSNEASEPVSQKPAQTDQDDLQTSNMKKKWKAPPGYFTQAKKNQRSFERIKRKNPKLNEEEVKEIMNATQRKWKHPPNYHRKDVFIERKKKAIMKQHPNIQPETAEKEANEHYVEFVKGRRERVENKKEENRKTREYIKSVDKDLASSILITASNKKKDWIERRTKWLKTRNPDWKHSEAEGQAYKQYDGKRAKENIRRRERYRQNKLQQNQQ